MADEDETWLTRFQIEVANLIFVLPASAGFLLAGGAALLAQHLTARPTHELDFFTRPGGVTSDKRETSWLAPRWHVVGASISSRTLTPSAD